jgi:hypothetical protein
MSKNQIEGNVELNLLSKCMAAYGSFLDGQKMDWSALRDALKEGAKKARRTIMEQWKHVRSLYVSGYGLESRKLEDGTVVKTASKAQLNRLDYIKTSIGLKKSGGNGKGAGEKSLVRKWDKTAFPERSDYVQQVLSDLFTAIGKKYQHETLKAIVLEVVAE